MSYGKRAIVVLMCLSLLFTAALPGSSSAARIKQTKIRGYITNVISPTSFEIEDYRITRDGSVVLEFENESAELKFKPEDIRVGAEVEITGELNDETNELKAKKIKIDLEQFRKFKMTAILSRKPEGLEQTAEGWRGTFFPDGHRVRVEPSTEVMFKPTKTEQKAETQRAKQKPQKTTQAQTSPAQTPQTQTAEAQTSPAQTSQAQASQAETAEEDDPATLQPLRTLADVGPGTVMTYEGTEQPDGTIAATRVVFMRNELEKPEAALWKSLKLKEKAADFVAGKPGELKIDSVGKFKLLPNQEVQAYVSNLGQSLVPAYQRALPEGNPLKIPFRFYVIVKKEPNAFALANGVVVVHSGLFDVLENEAQLASVLSHEIAHATQEHTWRQMQKDKKKRMALQIGGLAAMAFGLYGVNNILDLIQAAMVNGYQRTLENQADRVGLEYMVAAGYDPREAPRVWKLMAQKYGDSMTNFFWSNHDNLVTRRSFLMWEIRNNYSQLDFAQMKKGSEQDFQRLALLVNDAAAKKKTIKVKA
jgi:Zn-dependent protease with chaperone function